MSKYPNDYGFTLVVLKNISNAISRKNIATTEELHDLLDQIQATIQEQRPVFESQILDVTNCDHEFWPTTYTVENMVIGYRTLYQRKCKICKYTESFAVHCDDQADTNYPEWTNSAHNRYFNNTI